MVPVKVVTVTSQEEAEQAFSLEFPREEAKQAFPGESAGQAFPGKPAGKAFPAEPAGQTPPVEVRCIPMRGPLNLTPWLAGGRICRVVCAGGSGAEEVPLDFRWVRDLRTACVRAGVPFLFLSTGSHLVKDGKLYRIPEEQREVQAEKSGMSYIPGHNDGAKIHYRLPDREELFRRLAGSKFRSGFHLNRKDLAYLREKGEQTIREHAADFVRKRLAPENPPKDGKQTPMRGHPVFPAQHATACCCRSCLEKWHGIPSGKVLTEEEQGYIVDVIMEWIRRQA